MSSQQRYPSVVKKNKKPHFLFAPSIEEMNPPFGTHVHYAQHALSDVAKITVKYGMRSHYQVLSQRNWQTCGEVVERNYTP